MRILLLIALAVLIFGPAVVLASPAPGLDIMQDDMNIGPDNNAVDDFPAPEEEAPDVSDEPAAENQTNDTDSSAAPEDVVTDAGRQVDAAAPVQPDQTPPPQLTADSGASLDSYTGYVVALVVIVLAAAAFRHFHKKRHERKSHR